MRHAFTHGSVKPGITPGEFAQRYPRLYHMAEPDSWEGIRRHGLLSTTGLLDLFQVHGDRRRDIESRHRATSVVIQHEVHGRAVIRDQKPMDDVGLKRALRDGFTPTMWYELLNRHVFFWLTERRLETLLSARAYRDKRHAVLTVDATQLLARYSDRLVLSPYNTGATKPMPHPRGRDCFLPLSDYPYGDWWRARRGRDPVVEVAIPYSVPDVEDVVVQVTLVGGGKPTTHLWPGKIA